MQFLYTEAVHIDNGFYLSIVYCPCGPRPFVQGSWKAWRMIDALYDNPTAKVRVSGKFSDLWC